MSGVSHSFADGIQCIIDICFVSRRTGGQILLSKWICDLHVVEMAISWSGGYGGTLYTNVIYLSMDRTPFIGVGQETKPKKPRHKSVNYACTCSYSGSAWALALGPHGPP